LCVTSVCGDLSFCSHDKYSQICNWLFLRAFCNPVGDGLGRKTFP
jgi:hypothetical protein